MFWFLLIAPVVPIATVIWAFFCRRNTLIKTITIILSIVLELIIIVIGPIGLTEFWLLLTAVLIPFVLLRRILRSPQWWHSECSFFFFVFLVSGGIFISAPVILLLINTGFHADLGNWFSKEQPARVDCLSRDCTILAYSGSLDEDGYVALTSAVNKSPSHTNMVTFRSGGGSTETALKLAAFLNERNITAFVRHSTKNPDCGSACVNVFASTNSHNADRNATFMLHVTRIGLLRSYGTAVDLIIAFIETGLDQRFMEHIAVYLGRSNGLSEDERTEQAVFADKLAGKSGSRLRKQIESCPKPNPFESLSGITLSYSEIEAIEKYDISIVCPSS